MRTRIIAGNWKMNSNPGQAKVLASEIVVDCAAIRAVESGVTVVLCPPYTSLEVTINLLSGTGLHVGGQNCHHEPQGAYTGEISAEVLAAIGCSYVIVGHSERRRDQNETDSLIGKKAERATASGLTPIICIGETLQERQEGVTMEVIQRQISEIVKAAGRDVVCGSVIAYEPVWAIGTGLAATPEQAQEVHSFIRKSLVDIGAVGVSLLYGGSVTETNAAELFTCQDIDGALVGGASLRSSSFASIISAASGQSAR